MARPRTIRLSSGGEVILRNVPADEADRIKELLTASSQGATETEEESVPVPSGDLPFHTFGLAPVGDTRSWNISKVEYNPLTKEARVVNVETVEEYRDWAEERFKILLVESGVLL